MSRVIALGKWGPSLSISAQSLRRLSLSFTVSCSRNGASFHMQQGPVYYGWTAVSSSRLLIGCATSEAECDWLRDLSFRRGIDGYPRRQGCACAFPGPSSTIRRGGEDAGRLFYDCKEHWMFLFWFLLHWIYMPTILSAGKRHAGERAHRNRWGK